MWTKVKPAGPEDNRPRCEQKVRRGRQSMCCGRLARLYRISKPYRGFDHCFGEITLCSGHTAEYTKNRFILTRIDRRRKKAA
jgi:hypothetical protein